MRSTPDREIWDYAHLVGAAIITKDADFANRRVLRFDGPSIVWIRRGNSSRHQLLEWFAPLFPEIVRALENGESVVEVV
jgi:predicted nuclease of predicted toxin-antitoxin system